MLEVNSITQDEFNIKKQEVNTLAFLNSKGKVTLSLNQNMPIPPETYAFVLEADYPYVRRLVLNGEISPHRSYLARLLQIDGDVIRDWVKHNEAHRRMIRNPENLKSKPMIGYVNFFEQYMIVEEWNQ